MSRNYVYRLTIGVVVWRVLVRLITLIAIGAILPLVPDSIVSIANVAVLVAFIVMMVSLVRPGIITKRSLRRREQVVTSLDTGGGLSQPRITTTLELRQLFAGDYQPVCRARSANWSYADMSYKIPISMLLAFVGIDIEETRYTSVLEIRLPRELPAMLFKHKRRRGTYRFVKRSQRTSLDVNFDDYFVTYFPHHYYIDARSIISPEVMMAMIDLPACDIEINGSSLLFYPGHVPAGEIASFIEKALQVERVLADHIVYYRDELLEDSNDRQSVSIVGKNLRQSSIMWLLMAMVFLAVSLLLFALWWQSDTIWRTTSLDIAYYATIMFLLSCGACVKAYNVNKSNRQKDRMSSGARSQR